jgi:hypothetical protein
MNPDSEQEHAISVQVQVARDDYRHAYRRRFWRSLGWLVLLGAALALLPIARAPAFRAELAAGAPAAFAVAGAVYIGVALFLALMVEVLAHSFSRYALRKSPAALQPQVVTFTNDGVRTQGSHVPWNEFSGVVETRSAFQLQLRAGPYMLLPCRQISSVVQIRRLLKTHLGKSAKVRR